MRVDFYQLSRDPVEQMVTKIARKVLDMGERLLVVASQDDRLEAIEKALWSDGPGQFLANGYAAKPFAERQPILLGGDCKASNGAHIAIFADGAWREDTGDIDRVLLAFDSSQTDDARQLWRRFAKEADKDCHIFKQAPDGRWREGK